MIHSVAQVPSSANTQFSYLSTSAAEGPLLPEARLRPANWRRPSTEASATQLIVVVLTASVESRVIQSVAKGKQSKSSRKSPKVRMQLKRTKASARKSKGTPCCT